MSKTTGHWIYQKGCWLSNIQIRQITWPENFFFIPQTNYQMIGPIRLKPKLQMKTWHLYLKRSWDEKKYIQKAQRDNRGI